MLFTLKCVAGALLAVTMAPTTAPRVQCNQITNCTATNVVTCTPGSAMGASCSNCSTYTLTSVNNQDGGCSCGNTCLDSQNCFADATMNVPVPDNGSAKIPGFSCVNSGTVSARAGMSSGPCDRSVSVSVMVWKVQNCPNGQDWCTYTLTSACGPAAGCAGGTCP